MYTQDTVSGSAHTQHEGIVRNGQPLHIPTLNTLVIMIVVHTLLVTHYALFDCYATLAHHSNHLSSATILDMPA
jgi:hypothetical protein